MPGNGNSRLCPFIPRKFFLYSSWTFRSSLSEQPLMPFIPREFIYFYSISQCTKQPFIPVYSVWICRFLSLFTFGAANINFCSFGLWEQQFIPVYSSSISFVYDYGRIQLCCLFLVSLSISIAFHRGKAAFKPAHSLSELGFKVNSNSNWTLGAFHFRNSRECADFGSFFFSS